MRIIAGDLKGRKLYAPNDNRIRPTSDKVKESLFNMIAGYIEDAVVIDLFSGTGNLGLEAISRGACRCYFGDNSKESIDLTNKNIVHCKVQDQSTTIIGNYDRVLKRIPEKVDLIFLDPPYKHGLIERCLLAVFEMSLMNENGIIAAEHDANECFPEKIFNFIKLKEKKYGTIGITIYGFNLEENSL